MSSYGNTNNEMRKLGELIRDVQFAMATTKHVDGSLTSRPLTTLDVQFEGRLWFLVAADSEMVSELAHHSEINLAYAAPESGHYVSVSGVGRATRNPERARELWNLAAKVWFKGPDDPNLAVLEVEVERAEYWDSPGGRMERLFEAAKATLGGETSALGVHRKLDLSHRRSI